MSKIFFWPLDEPISEIQQGLIQTCQAIPLKDPTLSGIGAGDAVVVIVAELNEAHSATAMIEAVATFSILDDVRLVFIANDSYLGTEEDWLGPSMVSAVAVSAARSISIRQGGGTRANVVCVANEFFGGESILAGPLRREVATRDVIDAVSFFLEDGSSYLSGQVLFVDGGRHLFSSMSS